MSTSEMHGDHKQQEGANPEFAKGCSGTRVARYPGGQICEHGDHNLAEVMNRCMTRIREMLVFFFGRCKFTILLFLLSNFSVGGAYAQTIKPGEVPVDGEPTKSTVAPNTTQAEDYIIGPDDMLNVYILDVPELSREYRVSTTGTVTLPVLAKPLVAAGLTLSQFSDQLSRELQAQGLVSDPHITLSINQSRLHSVAITGAVKHPQVYPVFSQTTLLDVLSQAEGLADDAGNIAIVRRGDIGIRALHLSNTSHNADQTQDAGTLTIDLKRLLQSGDPSLNPIIYPGDRITVPRAGVVYVVGSVHKPGGFTVPASTHGMTVLQALALAENPTGTAKTGETVILRSDPQAPDGRKRIPVDLKAIMRGKNLDPVLQAEDILFVPDSAGKEALKSTESVLMSATNAVIYRF
jgi:polysaccharide export outer membrane protein